MKRNIILLLLCLCLTLGLATVSLAADVDPYSISYVIAEEGYLSNDEVIRLRDKAADITETYGCGVYIAQFNDMSLYGYHDADEFGAAVYESFDLGVGPGRDGILLVLSMAGRDYCLYSYGSNAYAAFPDRGKDILEEAFLPEFGEDNWYGGFSEYLSVCETLLKHVSSGKAVDEDSFLVGNELVQRSFVTKLTGNVKRSVLPGLAAAFIYCLLLSRKMKSVKAAREARAYVSGQTVMRVSTDRFTHTTVVRQHIERNSGGGGGGSHSGGHSHSGKF